MGRPNIDIPQYIIGGMRDYAEREGIERDEAYVRFLGEKLQEEGVLPPGTIPQGDGEDENEDEDSEE